MNRTFLILLMIGTAMMIAVIGQRKPLNSLDYMPWEVDLLKNGSTRVLGITLGKTTIQEANQIFASFAQSRLIRNNGAVHHPASELASADARPSSLNTPDTNNQTADNASTDNEATPPPDYQLIARYNNLNFDGLVAEVQLLYQLDKATILALRNTLKIDKTTQTGIETRPLEYEIDKQNEMSWLSTPVAGITFIPSIDYDKDTIQQRFGQAAKQLKINENEQHWLYPEFGLKIFIYADRPDRFVYSSIMFR
ncbi:hypothetical protein MNBD_GAMMA10-1344 [hydrothermal vent metagenome]|uniref:Uncharacterized protein n=1 Tax=hydrothermal vent metagenome TaxID=652676 RepID=A0A3B0XZ48_9ZZZZ